MKSGEREAYLPGSGNTEDSSNNGSGFGGFPLLLFFFLLLCFFLFPSVLPSCSFVSVSFVPLAFSCSHSPSFFVLGCPPSLCFLVLVLSVSCVFFSSSPRFCSFFPFSPFLLSLPVRPPWVLSLVFLWFFSSSRRLFFLHPPAFWGLSLAFIKPEKV